MVNIWSSFDQNAADAICPDGKLFKNGQSNGACDVNTVSIHWLCTQHLRIPASRSWILCFPTAYYSKQQPASDTNPFAVVAPLLRGILVPFQPLSTTDACVDRY